MKRFTLVLAILVVFSAIAFAEEAAPALKFSGVLETGINYAFGDETDAVFQRDNNDGVNGYRLNLNGAYENGNFGTYFRIRAQKEENPVTVAGNFYLPYAYAQGKFFGMLTVQAGTLSATPYATLGDSGWDLFNGDDYYTGVQAYVTPIEGLSIGAFIPAYVGQNAGYSLEDTMKLSGIGAAYSMKDMFDLTVAYQFATTTFDGTTAPADDTGYFIGSVALNAVPNLTANLEAKIDAIENTNTAYDTLTQTVAYTIGAIKPQVVAYEYLGEDFGYSITPSVAYTMGSTTYKLAFNMKNTCEGDASWYLNPTVAIALGANTLKFSYKYQSSDVAIVGTDKTLNTFYVNYVWKF
jgi:hypothetical protein